MKSLSATPLPGFPSLPALSIKEIKQPHKEFRLQSSRSICEIVRFRNSPYSLSSGAPILSSSLHLPLEFKSVILLGLLGNSGLLKTPKKEKEKGVVPPTRGVSHFIVIVRLAVIGFFAIVHYQAWLVSLRALQ